MSIEKRKKYRKTKRGRIVFLIGLIIGAGLMLLGNRMMSYTSTDEYCMSCHIHPEADEAWQMSPHHNTKSGVVVHCVDCHLPPEEHSFKYLRAKAGTGLNDLWQYYTKDSASFDWQKRKQLDYAVKIVYNESCENCHKNLFTKNISGEGAIAHLYYDENRDKLNLQCISCHLNTGHFDPNYSHTSNKLFGNASNEPTVIYDSATKLTGFKNFTEKIPGTPVSFNMVAIAGGTFSMGSPDKESYRQSDESPVREVSISPFYIGEAEVTWDEYMAFYSETRSEGRIPPETIFERNRNPVDGISGPTPPYGQPDQGWGYGKNPAITMSYYSAEMYCKWLSLKTGKTYRLPTEAEWEYAARGNTTSPYFFDGSPKSFTRDFWWNSLFGVDTAVINTYAIYAENSNGRPKTADKVAANPFGVKNMLGNVMEYCSDWYAKDAYSQTGASVDNPKGPAEGTEHVVRGGNFSDDAKDLRVARRDYTRTAEWLKTDPQSPKSIWWLSDCVKIGFRVVCEK